MLEEGGGGEGSDLEEAAAEGDQFERDRGATRTDIPTTARDRIQQCHPSAGSKCIRREKRKKAEILDLLEQLLRDSENEFRAVARKLSLLS